MGENPTTPEERVEFLKQKNPSQYKALTIAGLGYFDDSEIVPTFVKELEEHINEKSSILLSGGIPELKFPIPQCCVDLDNSIASLVKDINEKTVTSQIAGIRMKELVSVGLNDLKDVTKKFTVGDEESIEHCLGVYDLVMSLQGVAALADNNL